MAFTLVFLLGESKTDNVYSININLGVILSIMIAFLYSITKKAYKANSKIGLMMFRISKLIINILMPVYYRFWHKVGVDANSEVIISLTSFPDRINCVWLTIVSLMNQSVRAKRILLWLSSEQFENVTIPKNLLNLEKYGLEIKYCEDLKPHKKYYYTMKDYPEYYIAIADDDIFYPENHLEVLLNGLSRCKDAVIAQKTHHIEFDIEGTIKQYTQWKDTVLCNPSFLLVPIGCNGVLYPPNFFDNRLSDLKYIKEKVLFTDDLWLKINSILKGIKTFSCIENELVYFDIIKVKDTGLWRSNTTGDNRNDRVWSALMNDYPEVEQLLYECWKEESEYMRNIWKI